MITINENIDIILESIPWRNGNIQFSIGKTVIKDVPHDCFILNDVKRFMKLNPSFMFCIPATDGSNIPFNAIKDKGNKTNGYVIIAKEAQQIGYSKTDNGTCKAKTYFFGRPNEDRQLDIWFRIFERGFSISNIKGIEIFNGTEEFNITTNKKDYSKSSLISGQRIATPIIGESGKIIFKDKNLKYIPARISHK